MDCWTYFAKSQSSLDENSKWAGLSEHALVFIGGVLRLLVTAADLGDCAWSGAAVSQSPGFPLGKLASRLRLSPKATRDTCNLSPL